MIQTYILLILFIYFAVLLGISQYTSRKATNDSYFRSGRSASWYLVAFGMVGTSLSGVTFVSVPGGVTSGFFYYFQVVIGYFLGYIAVAFILLPLYYRLNLTSIYHYLQQRFGMTSYKTGALIFIVSRTLGATIRLYLVINVLQLFVLDEMGVNFYITTIAVLLMIILYTYKGGVKTIVWTDTLQTFFMLLSLVVCVYYILDQMGWSLCDAWAQLESTGRTKIFNSNLLEKSHWFKHILGGAFITISMTGLDQEMMQKNISVKTLKDAQKNMMTFSVIMVFVNFIFLLLGGLLFLYAQQNHILAANDDLFPTIAMKYLPPAISILFIVGLISALFPSADGAITALTASYCIDILGINRNPTNTEEERTKTRKRIHLVFAFVFLLMVIVFKWIDNKNIVDTLLAIAGYTYGPLLGLFAFGILTRRTLLDKYVPFICLLSPTLAYLLDKKMAFLLNGYVFGYELLLLNGIITFGGLWLISKNDNTHTTAVIS